LTKQEFSVQNRNDFEVMSYSFLSFVSVLSIPSTGDECVAADAQEAAAFHVFQDFLATENKELLQNSLNLHKSKEADVNRLPRLPSL